MKRVGGDSPPQLPLLREDPRPGPRSTSASSLDSSRIRTITRLLPFLPARCLPSENLLFAVLLGIFLISIEGTSLFAALLLRHCTAAKCPVYAAPAGLFSWLRRAASLFGLIGIFEERSASAGTISLSGLRHDAVGTAVAVRWLRGALPLSLLFGLREEPAIRETIRLGSLKEGALVAAIAAYRSDARERH